MSYCRWGIDSDLYLYDAGYGYSLSLASRRHESDTPRPSEKYFWDIILGSDDKDVICERFKVWRDEQDQWREQATLVDIDLPFAGMSFGFDDTQDLIGFIRQLQELGYRIHEQLIQRVLEDPIVQDL